MAKPQLPKTLKQEKIASLNWIIWGATLSTLTLWTTTNDPFNAPKSWVLSVTAFWLLGWVLVQSQNKFKISALKWATTLCGFFVLSLSVAFLATDNKYIGFFGEYQRRTGYLTYLSFTIFFLASAYSFRLHGTRKLEIAGVLTGIIVGVYGFAQHFKVDFAKFQNPYNPVISTLGNPDFAAAVMSLFLILSFGVLIQNKYSYWVRILAGSTVVLLFITIQFSQVRQGLLTSILGIGIVLIVWLHQKNRKIAYVVTFFSFSTLGLAILGMLKMGPLVKYFYKASVTFRGDYFRAGWRMFIHHPFFGVGLDRYGAYFRQYRDAKQAVRRGPDLISNAAHNVPLQLASTGGVLVFLSFILLTIFILCRGIISIRKTSGAQQILVSVIFAAWIAYEAQSMISIDNIGIAVWGYVLGGAVVGLSIDSENEESNKKSHFQPILSIGLMAIPVVISILLFKAESAAYQLQRTQINSSNVNSADAEKLLSAPLSFGLQEPNFEIVIATIYGNSGRLDKTQSILENVLKSDPTNYSAIAMLARVAEIQKRWSDAVILRTQIVRLDPYNTLNLFELGQDKKSSGDIRGAKSVIPLIDAIDPTGSDAKKAHVELVG